MDISYDPNSSEKFHPMAEAFRRRSAFESPKGRWLLTDGAVFFVPAGGKPGGNPENGGEKYSALRWENVERIQIGPGMAFATAYGSHGETVPLPDGDLPFKNRLLDLLEKYDIEQEMISLRIINRNRMKATLKTAGATGSLWRAQLYMIPAWLVTLLAVGFLVFLLGDDVWGFGRSVLRGISMMMFVFCGWSWLFFRCCNVYWTAIENEYRRSVSIFRSLSPEQRNRLYEEIKAADRAKTEQRAERRALLLKELRYTPRQVHRSLQVSWFSAFRNFLVMLYLVSPVLFIPYFFTDRDACRTLLPFCWSDAGTGIVVGTFPREGVPDGEKMVMLEIERLDEAGKPVTLVDHRRFPKKRYEPGKRVELQRFRNTDLYRVAGFGPIFGVLIPFIVFSAPIFFIGIFAAMEMKRELRTPPILENGIIASGLVTATGVNRCDVILADDDGYEGPTIGAYCETVAVGDEVLVLYLPDENGIPYNYDGTKKPPVTGHVVDPPTLSVVYDEDDHCFREKRYPVLEPVIYSVLGVETILWGLIVWTLACP